MRQANLDNEWNFSNTIDQKTVVRYADEEGESDCMLRMSSCDWYKCVCVYALNVLNIIIFFLYKSGLSMKMSTRKDYNKNVNFNKTTQRFPHKKYFLKKKHKKLYDLEM